MTTAKTITLVPLVMLGTFRVILLPVVVGYIDTVMLTGIQSVA